MSEQQSWLKRLLFRRVPSEQLAIFRIVFGGFMLFETLWYVNQGLIPNFFVVPELNFSYPLFGWLKPLPTAGLWLVLIAMIVSSLGIMLGRLYKFSIVTFTVGFSYFFFMEKALYNNHLYLICLLGLLLSLMHADKSLSLSKRHAGYNKKVPFWNILVLRLQFFIVYFYGGLAKLSYDWLVAHEPVKTMIESRLNRGAPDFLGSPVMEAFFTYGGIGFDLLIGFALWWKPTRWFAVAGVLFFNLTNAWLFNDIYIFPFFMICATILFFEPETVKGWVDKLRARQSTKTQKKGQKLKVQPVNENKWATFFIAYMAFQFLFPFKHFIIPGNADWTGEWQRFCWHMKVQTRQVEQLDFMIYNYDTKEIYGPVAFSTYGLSDHHVLKHMALDPEMLIQFAHHMGEKAAAEYGMRNIEIKVEALVSFNGREPQYMVDPELDLLSVSYNPLKHNDFILPLKPATGE